MEEKTDTPVPLKTAQSSIRSFFKPKTPNYTSMPPASSPAASSPPPASITSPIPREASESTASPSNATSALSVPPKPTLETRPPAHAVSVSGGLSPKPALPPQATITVIEPSHIASLKRINALLLCITYPDTFYTTILASTAHPSFSRAILWSPSPTPTSSAPTLIGGLVTRIEPSPGANGTSTLYIQSLALLSPYRRYGLATAALDHIISGVIAHPLAEPITSLYAHVWTENEDGLEWYKKRGFTITEPVVHGYYRRLKPDTAWILRRTLGPSDHIKHAASSPSVGPAADATPAVQRSGPPKSGTSFQTMRPESEWNDLPTDILLPGRSGPGTDVTSIASSRSSSVAPKKKRQYPAAAFAAGSGSGNGSQS
jgi:ribosomal protein S18 acetylase RimI-like enzyme